MYVCMHPYALRPLSGDQSPLDVQGLLGDQFSVFLDR